MYVAFVLPPSATVLLTTDFNWFPVIVIISVVTSKTPSKMKGNLYIVFTVKNSIGNVLSLFWIRAGESKCDYHWIGIYQLKRSDTFCGSRAHFDNKTSQHINHQRSNHPIFWEVCVILIKSIGYCLTSIVLYISVTQCKLQPNFIFDRPNPVEIDSRSNWLKNRDIEEAPLSSIFRMFLIQFGAVNIDLTTVVQKLSQMVYVDDRTAKTLFRGLAIILTLILAFRRVLNRIHRSGIR